MQKFTLNLAAINDGFVIETNDTESIKVMRELDATLTYQQRQDLLTMLLLRIERNFYEFMSGQVDEVNDPEVGEYTRDDFATDCMQAAFTQQQLTN